MYCLNELSVSNKNHLIDFILSFFLVLVLLATLLLSFCTTFLGFTNDC